MTNEMGHLKRNVTIIIVFLVVAFLISQYIERNKSESIITPPTKEEASSDELKEITYTNASADMIVVELPFPGAVVGKEFSVIGKARGNWFFEASFPFDLRDPSGKIIAQSYAQAEGEWMTTEFVPFKGEIKVPISYIGPAILVLMKDNPSGLPEHDASISFPIIVEY